MLIGFFMYSENWSLCYWFQDNVTSHFLATPFPRQLVLWHQIMLRNRQVSHWGSHWLYVNPSPMPFHLLQITLFWFVSLLVTLRNNACLCLYCGTWWLFPAAEPSYVSRLHHFGMKVQSLSFLLVHWERPARCVDQKKVAAYNILWLAQWNNLVMIMKSLSQK